MDEISGTYHDGRIDLDRPVDWPEGARVAVVPQTETIGMREEDWPDTPAAREELSRQIASFEPLEMTPQEEREWEEARQAVKEYTLEAMRKPRGLPS